MKLKQFIYKKVNSTNDSAIRIIKNSNNDAGIVIADSQKKGRGRVNGSRTSKNGSGEKEKPNSHKTTTKTNVER